MGETSTRNSKTDRKAQDQLIDSIRLGMEHSIGSLASRPDRDILIQDFMAVEETYFPSIGSTTTQPHNFTDFRFKSYAPIAFRYFRDLFGIQRDDFLMSMCSVPPKALGSAGASGSAFFVTQDDKFVLKTVSSKESRFLRKLLPAYYMNLKQNPNTLLPKFLALFCYQCTTKKIRLVAMNNLLPTTVQIHLKYDLKGSTYKRLASPQELQKKCPTFKDLDFMKHHPEGIFLEESHLVELVKTMQRDCRVLQSFQIMDYSLLLGVRKVDSTEDTNSEISGGVFARNAKGERMILFIGVIDILQSYRFRKKVEHAVKSIIHDGDSVSVHRPGFYSERFINFMTNVVFKRQNRIAL